MKYQTEPIKNKEQVEKIFFQTIKNNSLSSFSFYPNDLPQLTECYYFFRNNHINNYIYFTILKNQYKKVIKNE